MAGYWYDWGRAASGAIDGGVVVSALSVLSVECRGGVAGHSHRQREIRAQHMQDYDATLLHGVPYRLDKVRARYQRIDRV